MSDAATTIADTPIAATVRNPFPGLRTFDATDSHLFFGREAQTDELLKRLGRQRFVAVVGTSGSGKSSLVRAGLLPTLFGGFLSRGGSDLSVACFRPGDRPITRLAEALAEIPGVAPEAQDAPTRAAWIEVSLRRSGLGLIETTRSARLPAGRDLLIIVDQFEELFRYAPEEASAFVRLLLEAVHQTDLPIYVVITMRSDYLGECATFRDLPEALNDAQYLVPRMTRDQRRLAIEGPARVAHGRMAPGLVNRLLNDSGDAPDQLPILQHALMRTWDHWEARPDRPEEVELADYLAIGGTAEAMARHADGTFETLPAGRPQQLAVIVLKRLTARDAGHREVRRPAKVQELLDVTGATLDELRVVLDAFLATGRSFLTRSPTQGPLTPDVVIDISHESLIRIWNRLRAWAEDEAQSADTYRRLADRADLHAQHRAGLLVNPELDLALKWRAADRPTAAWARRYPADFDLTLRFLDESRHAAEAASAEREAARRRDARRSWIQRLGLVAAVAIVLFGYLQWRSGRETQTLVTRLRLLEALNVEDQGERLRAAHLLAQAGDAADDDHRQVAAFNIWQYAQVLPSALQGLDGRIRDVRHGGARWSASWTDRGDLRLWSRETGALVGPAQSHPGAIGARFSHDAGRLATWSKDGIVRLWRTAGGLQLDRTLTLAGLESVEFTDRDRYLVLRAADGQAQVSAVETGRALVIDRADAPDGFLVSDACDCALAWSAGSLSPSTAKGSGAYDNGGAAPGASGSGGTAGGFSGIKRWDLAAVTPRARVLTTTPVSGVAMSADGRRALTWSAMPDEMRQRRAGSEPVWHSRVWNLATGRVEIVLEGEVWRAMFDPAGASVLTVGGGPVARWWRLDEPAAPVLLTHQRDIQDARFLRDGRVLTWDSGTVKVWPARMSPVSAVTTRGATGLARTLRAKSDAAKMDGARGRVAAQDSSAEDVGTEDIATEDVAMESPTLRGIELSADEALMATVCADGSAGIWDLRTGRLLRAIGSRGTLRDVAFGPTHTTVLAAGTDGRLRLFDVSPGLLSTSPPRIDTIIPGIAHATLLDDRRVLAWSDRAARDVTGPDRAIPDRATPDRAVPDRAVPDRAVPDRAGFEGALSGRVPTGDTSSTSSMPDWIVSAERSAVVNGRPFTRMVSDVTGRRVAAIAADGSVGVFDDHGAKTTWLIPTAAALLVSAAVSTDGQWVLACSNTAPSSPTVPFASTAPAAGPSLASPQRDAAGAGPASESKAPSVADAPVPARAFASPVTTASPLCQGSLVELWNVADPARGAARVPVQNIEGAVFDPRGRWLVTWSSAQADVWTLPDLKRVGPVRLPDSPAARVAGAIFSADGSQLLVWRDRGDALVVPAAAPTGPARTLRFDLSLAGVALSTDGARVAGWGEPAVVAAGPTANTVVARTLDVSTGRVVGPDLAHSDKLVTAVFAGIDRLVTLTSEGAARIWTIGDDNAVAFLKHDGPVRGLAYGALASGARAGWILTWADGGTARLWNARNGLPISHTLKHTSAIHQAQFTPDDGAIVAYGVDGSVQPWSIDADLDFGIRPLRARFFGRFASKTDTGVLTLLARVASGSQMDRHGSIVPLSASAWTRARTELEKELARHHDEDDCRHKRLHARLLAAMHAMDPSSAGGGTSQPTSHARQE